MRERPCPLCSGPLALGWWCPGCKMSSERAAAAKRIDDIMEVKFDLRFLFDMVYGGLFVAAAAVAYWYFFGK